MTSTAMIFASVVPPSSESLLRFGRRQSLKTCVKANNRRDNSSLHHSMDKMEMEDKTVQIGANW